MTEGDNGQSHMTLVADVSLVLVAAIVLIVGAPIYGLARIAVMLDNRSLGLPADYGL